MAKKKSGGLNKLKSLLTPKEYQEYRNIKQVTESARAKASLARMRSNLSNVSKAQSLSNRNERYEASRSGKVARFFNKAINKTSRRNFMNIGYSQVPGQQGMVMPSQGQGQRRSVKAFGGRGRPKGTLDPRYAKYGGVYGFRKYTAQQNRLQKIAAIRQNQITPQQDQLLRAIQARNMAQQQAPENQTIPDTTGMFNLNGFMDEINRASQEVD